MRGDWNSEEKEEEGLFNNLFEFAMERDTDLVACQKHMPANKTYKSPQIQNEFISVIAHMLRARIVDEVKKADAGVFTILVDGTKDKNGIECVSIAVRFVSNGKPIESLLFFESTENVDALGFTQLMLKSLESYGLDANNILSQCYDGAPVMNGYKSGVVKRIQDTLKKTIPYVHCFNHRLRLVIIYTVQQVSGVKEFFEQIQLIYTAFKKPKIKKVYEGSGVKRLIDTRWTGHYQATKSVFENYTNIVATLHTVKNDIYNTLKLDGDDIATCIGILNLITQKKFVFILIFMTEFLTALTPADAYHQKRESSYHNAVGVINAVKSTIADYRKPEKFDEFMSKTETLMTGSVPNDIVPRSTRNRQRPMHLNDFVIEETTGERPDENVQIKSCYEEVINVALAEFDSRFAENDEILLALSNSPKMELNDLKPLEKLGLTLPPEHEMKTAKNYVDNKREEFKELKKLKESANVEDDTHFQILSVLNDVREAFPEVYELFATIETFACSTAVCEASFSALAQINIASRLSMTNERMRNLSFIAFEQKRLKNISKDDILKEFNNRKNRKVQLF